MQKDLNEEVKRLKRDLLQMEQVGLDEKDALIKVIHAFGTVVATHPEMEEECRAIEEDIRKLQKRIVEAEKEVAERLRETFRRGDFIARFGGDEFAVIIEQMTEEMGRERISSFHKNLDKRRFTSYKKGDITVRSSAGMAVATATDSAESLLERADKAMYASKPKKG